MTIIAPIAGYTNWATTVVTDRENNPLNAEDIAISESTSRSGRTLLDFEMKAAVTLNKGENQ